MAIKFLLRCPCGETIQVQPRQAGDRVKCDCGANLEVPALSRLRQLPQADDTPSSRKSLPWGLREGLMTVAGIAALALLAAGSYFWLNQPANWTQRADANIESWTPQEAWQYWCVVYRPITTGRSEEIATIDPMVSKQIRMYQLGRWTCFGLAGLALAIGIWAAYALDNRPPAPPAPDRYRNQRLKNLPSDNLNSSQQAGPPQTDSTPTDPPPLKCVHYLDAVREEAGGVVRAVLDLVQAVSDAGAEVTLLTGDSTDCPSDWRTGRPGSPRVVTLSRRMTPWLSVAAADRLAVDTALAPADVLHLHTPWDPYNLALAAAARRHSVPYVVSIHGMLDDWSMSNRMAKKRLYLALAGQRMLGGAYRIHLTAEDESRQAMKWAPRGTACVLPLVMDLSPYRELPGPEIARAAFPSLGKPGAKLLFLSRVHPKKGVELLVDVVDKMRRRGDEVQALIAGPGEDAYVAALKQRAQTCGVADHVHFLGMVRGQEKLSLYQASDLFVLPTSQENFGIVLTEAMACGTPVVTTRGVDIWRELQERGATIVDRDVESIVAAIDGLLAEGDALANRGQESRRGVFEWLDPQTVTAGYLDLYREAATHS